MDFYDIKECTYTPVKIKTTGWLEHRYLEREDFTECYISTFEDLAGIESIRYYPCQNFSGAKEKKHGKIELCNQEFDFIGDDIFLHKQIFYLIQYNENRYLVLIGNLSAYYLYKYFIFDITDLKKIRFYELDNAFYNKDIDPRIFGIFRDQLCFFVAQRVYQWNGDYFLCPYIIKDGKLREFIDSDGTEFRVYFSYITKPYFEFKIVKCTF
ncbi:MULTISPECIES: hypothetical protein [unclassified Treponema]|uniref:hypothetical protein n=1 Tax=unclassified Treponema TaxID=2638727 RepID=UPI0020A35760|nr:MULTISPECIES: hypothetical protein [unclassified Treponema]UTC66244.1 hypothetical protein E4O06_09610 [Treponema sp. OMZ 789]UTC68973.1 hypothetical protein E4O01_09740 [Treponema sp. OMZ 790]UTC71700.1 hypothetical protein E4O02_09930 [Treponema sp. OMZ 791]